MFALETVDETLKVLKTRKTGLSDAEVEVRRPIEGFNELPTKKRSLFLLFLRQFRSIFVAILFVALGLSIVEPFLEGHERGVHSFLEAIAIGIILLLNALLGFLQEFKAEQAIELLKKLSSPTARVLRNGRDTVVPSRELLPGDIVTVEAGDNISADGRLMTTLHLEVNESSMTGESVPVTKTTQVLSGEPTLSEQRNMVFAGTVVTRGSGTFVVTATGKRMELGRIATLVSGADIPETPLQRKLHRLSLLLGIIVLTLAALVVLLRIVHHDLPIAQAVLMGVSLAVSAVPEGLPAIVTACLAIGVRHMAKRGVLVRRLEALETLGSVTVLCTDKTGTVTENRMQVSGIWIPFKDDKALLASVAASCNHAALPNVGDPTEIGLLRYAKEQGAERLPIDDEPVPFTSEQRYMATRHGKRLFFKGAPEKIVELLTDTGVSPAAILTQTAEYAKKGLRVLACAVQENGVTRFLGLLAMEDPVRSGVGVAVRRAATAGIRTVMITGDNLDTAKAVAERIGIVGDAVEGRELRDLTEEELTLLVRTTAVYARVAPEHKLAILHALQRNGDIVAMSGDGVNDAPALKGAHVGVAMGKVGTDVARDAASIVLTDDHFATMVSAVEEGRHIYDNIRKFILCLLQTNFYELLFFLSCALLGLPVPYLPLHILWINLVTDGLPALSLAMEEKEHNIMTRRPRPPGENVFSGHLGRIALATLLPFGIVLSLYMTLLDQGLPLEKVRTMCFTFAVLFELLFVSTVRSSRPLYAIGFFSNRWLVGAIMLPLLLQFALIYSPLAAVFELTPLTVYDWGLLVILASSGLVIFEAIKILQLIISGTFFAYRRNA